MSYAPELAAAPKTNRYEIIELLGRGATSIVYKAFDIEKNFIVALKCLKFPELDDIYNIKQEFRFFRDIYHPNLVNLYDLYAEYNLCFYTMEYIDGLDLVSCIRSPIDSSFCRPGDVDSFGALRVCLAQLFDGLTALHEQGRLHRDLKPSNILVERDARTVLLDFGLSTEARPIDSIVTHAKLYAGTPAYMAPEQLAGELASEASDSYSLGVVLYETLTGHRPYPDGPAIARYEAQKQPPESPRALCPDVPLDLNDLALALISFDPRDRLRLKDLKQSTTFAAQPHQLIVRPHPSALRQQFVGRDAELRRLESAFSRVVAGRPVAVCVSGVSGVGKTTLIERFLTDAHERYGTLVLRSRCHHQESVLYNAVDGLIDAVSRYLMLQSEEHLSEIAPKDLPALITMFPVLGRVSFPYEKFDRDEVGTDPHSIVRQALGALRELFQRIAAGRPVILWIDDLQWSDKNSLLLLCEIAAVAGGKPILSIFSYRTEDLHPDSVAAALERAIDTNPEIETEHIEVPPLDMSAVNTLIRRLMADDVQMDPAWVREVAQESAGLPFFVVELVEYNSQRAYTEQSGGDQTSVAKVLERRIRSLPPPQRALLEIVSVAGTPLSEEILVRIAAREAASGREIYQLLHQNLLRKGEQNGRHAVETFHDRIRTAVLSSLDTPTRRLRHKEIADEMAGQPEPNHALLVEHYLGADELPLAAENALRAGRHFAQRLAFNNAVEFFSLAWRLCEPGKEDWEVALELANALADAGRSAEAGELFLSAARWHARSEADPLRIASHEARAAQQFLYSGRLASGLDVYRKLFISLRIPFPSTLRAARYMSVTNRLYFAVGLRRLRVRSVRQIPPQDVMRLDMLWAAARGFLMHDYVVGDAMFSWYMREAAELGERSRVLRALAIESAVVANIGRDWSIKRSNTFLRRAQDLAAGSADSYDRVVLLTCRSSINWCRGNWREAAELASEAVELHRRECVRYDFEVPVALGYRVSAMVMLGSVSQAKAETLRAIQDAQQRGDFYVSRLFKSGYWVYIALAEDDPDTVIAESEVLLEEVPVDRFTSLHWSHFNAKVNALVYAGQAWDAWDLVQRQWPLIAAAGFLKFGCIGAHLREIRARAALKAAAAAGARPKSSEKWTRDRLLRIAEKDARRIAHTGALSHSVATAAAIRSGVAALLGERDRCKTQLEIAREGFAQARMSLHRAAAELQLGQLAAGDEQLSAAQRSMALEGIKRPDRMSKFLMFS